MAAAPLDPNGVIPPGPGVLIRRIRPGDGDGKFPQKRDTCVIHYDLFLANETDLKHKKLDDTRHRNLPFSWQVGAQQVIPGLDAAIQCLTQGQIAEIFIPAWFAYGAVGCPPWIPPHADLLYRVELVEIRAPDAAA